MLLVYVKCWIKQFLLDSFLLDNHYDRVDKKYFQGVTEYVKPYQNERLFWNGVWGAAGCPEVREL